MTAQIMLLVLETRENRQAGITKVDCIATPFLFSAAVCYRSGFSQHPFPI
jgi:hypothetical protein